MTTLANSKLKVDLTGIAAAITALSGCGMLFSAIVFLPEGALRAYREYMVDSRLVGTVATIEKRWLAAHEYHALRGDSKIYIFGDEFSLRCRLRYQFLSHQHVFDLDTLSSASLQTRAAIEKWIETHRPGAVLDIKVNPSNPDEVAVVSELPVPQFGTSREIWRWVLYLGAGGALLVALVRLLSGSTSKNS